MFFAKPKGPQTPKEYAEEAKRCITEMYARGNEADDEWIATMIEEIKEHADTIIACCRNDRAAQEGE